MGASRTVLCAVPFLVLSFAMAAPPRSAETPAALASRAAALEKRLDALEIRLDTILKKIDDVLWFERVGDVANVDKVFLTGPPNPKEEETYGIKNERHPFRFWAYVFVPIDLDRARKVIFGIGAVSNLSDGYPWGIWITYDVVVGTAIACGGYSIALLVYVFNKGEYHPLVRPALMASMFGYTMAGLSIMVDLGRYWQAYNLILPWYSNINSIMLEVAFCVSLYISVLWMEFSPTFAELLQAKGLKKMLDRVMFVFIAIGVLLPTMGQSSLGTLMVIAGWKLSPLWQTPFLPLLFLTVFLQAIS